MILISGNDKCVVEPIQTYPMCKPSLHMNEIQTLVIFFGFDNYWGGGRGLHFSPGWPRIHFVAQAGLKHMAILLSQLPACWDDRLKPLYLLLISVFKYQHFFPLMKIWSSHQLIEMPLQSDVNITTILQELLSLFTVYRQENRFRELICLPQVFRLWTLRARLKSASTACSDSKSQSPCSMHPLSFSSTQETQLEQEEREPYPLFQVLLPEGLCNGAGILHLK